MARIRVNPVAIRRLSLRIFEVNMQYADELWFYVLILVPFFLLGKFIISREVSLKYVYLCLSFVAVVYALAGPYRESKIPIRRFFFIFDISRSSTVADMNNEFGKTVSRLEFAKENFKKAIPYLPKGTSVALGSTITGEYSFEENANLKLLWPMTVLDNRNVGAFYKALGIVDWWNAWGDKSEWIWFFSSLAWLVENHLEKNINIVIFTDGGSDIDVFPGAKEMTASSLYAIKRSGATLTFLGIGGEIFRNVPEFDKDLKPLVSCFKKRDGSCFTSRFEEKNLKRVVELSGGKYVRMHGFNDLMSVIHNPQAKVSGSETAKENADTVFLLIALLFLILFFVL